MATTNLGRVRFNMRGDYNPDADPLYSLLDLVSDGGGSFVYINDTPSNEPTSSVSHWQQIAQKGETGPAGPANKVLGAAYATAQALAAAVTNPEEGDQYNVGSTPPYSVYRWTGAAWEDQGALHGPPGPAGPQGEPGPNSVTTSTATNITGLLKGAGGGSVSAATAGVDYTDATAVAMIAAGGVFSGGAVTAQGSPDQTVAVEAVSYVTPNGKRYSLSAVSALAATAADATNPRVDIVYGSDAGVVTYLAGTAAGSPTQPATPSNGTLLASIARAANDNTIAAGDITKKRKFIATAEQFVNWTLSTASANEHACDLLFLQHIQFAIVNADSTAKTLTFTNVPYGRCEVVIEIDATNYAPAFTWTLNSGSTVAWATTPAFVSGKTYVIVLKTKDSGATWDGYVSTGVA